MKVILLKDVKGTGKTGDVLEVSDGHGRNFLIPKGLARAATDSTIREQAHIKAAAADRKSKELAEAQAQGKHIESLTVTLKGKAGEGGKLFGSLTSKDIAEGLEKQHGIALDKRKIQLEHAIKDQGEKVVDVKLYPGVTCKLKINVTAE